MNDISLSEIISAPGTDWFDPTSELQWKQKRTSAASMKAHMTDVWTTDVTAGQIGLD